MRDKLLGRTIGDFQVEELLGRGSVGRVYRAIQVSLNREVALKVLEEGLFTLDDMKTRFHREAEYIARLEHPNIVPVYAAGQDGPHHYFAMRLIRGKTLAQALADGEVGRADGVRWIAQIAGALHYAHERGLIHRDIKPANIMIADGAAVLADFGLARLLETTTITATGALVGTPLYFSPEQAGQQKATPLSDLFALGIVLYEVAVGRHPFAPTQDPGPTREEIISRVKRGDYPRPRELAPDLPAELERVIVRALEVDPAKRHPSAREMQLDLQEVRVESTRAPLATRPSSPGTPRIEPEGRPFGRFRLIRELGHGGMGIVYHAWQTDLGRDVALKVLAGTEDPPDDVPRFEREARAAARLQHPNIVGIHEIGEVDGKHYFTMDLVDGESLEARVDRGALPAREACVVVRDAARAVHFAHERGIIHRDLKPGNILIAKDGRVVVTDFGLARQVTERPLTQSGDVLGTPAYMPPEQARGSTTGVDRRSDVYALGAVLYHLLAGRPPFAGPAMDVILAVIDAEPAPPGSVNPKAHADAETICLKAMEKDPRARYATAAELADDLDRFLNGEPIHARPVGTIGRLWRRAMRKPAVAGSVLVAVAAVAVTVGVLVAGAAGQSAAKRRRERADALLEPARKVHADLQQRGDALSDSEVPAIRARAFASIDEALREDREFLEPRILRARILDGLGECEAAVAAAREAVEAAPQAALPRIVLGRALLSRYRELREVPATRYAHGWMRVDRTPETGEEAALREASLGEFARARGLQGRPAPDDLYAAGAAALFKDEFAVARDRLREAVAADEFDIAAWRDLGIALHLLGEVDGAVDALKRAIRGRPRDSLAHAILAHTYAAAAQSLEAEGRDPSHHRSAAVAAMGAAVALRPRSAKYRIERGRMLLAAGRYAEAIADFDAAAAAGQMREFALADKAHAMILRAEALLDRGEGGRETLQEAVGAAQSAVEAAPGHPYPVEVRAIARLTLGKRRAWAGEDPSKDFDAGIADYEEVLRLREPHADDLERAAAAVMTRGELRLRGGESPSADFARAEELLERAERMSGRYHGVYSARCRLRRLQAQADPSRALALAGAAADEGRKASKLAPGLAEVRRETAVALLELGIGLEEAGREALAVTREALEEAREAARREPGADGWSLEGAALLRIAEALRRAGQPAEAELREAEKALTQALSANPTHSIAWSNLALARIARAKGLASRPSEAAAAWRAAARTCEDGLARVPDSAELAHHLGRCCTALGELAGVQGGDGSALFEQGVDAIARAVEIHRRLNGNRVTPRAVPMWENLAIARLKLGEELVRVKKPRMEPFAEAERACTVVLDLEPRNARVLAWRGHARYRQRKWTLSVADYEAAIRADGTIEPEVRRFLESARREAERE